MKKMSIIVATIICIISLCACGEAKRQEDNPDKLLTLQMQINIEEATLYLSDSNSDVIEATYAMKAMNWEKSVLYFEKALKLVKASKNKISTVISSPNFFSKELGELEENYEETIILLSRFSESEPSEDEINEVLNIMVDGTSKFALLFESLTAFSYLYEIRDFDQLSDDNLKDNWWKFGFNDIECPETIDKQELYFIWATKFFEEFDEDTFLKELKVLRELLPK